MRTRFGILRVKAVAAALAFALAVPPLFAAPSNPYVCYKPSEGQSIYPWDLAAKWFDTTGSGATINRVPTTNDYVFLYSSKNDVASNKKPMVGTNGVHAATGALEICDKDHGNTYVIGITVQDGGTMTNEGDVVVGNCRSGKTGGGLITIESGGEWTANGNFILGYSSGTSWLNVREGGDIINREHDHDGQVRGLVGDLERRLVRDRCAAPKRDDRHFQVNATGVSRPSCARE